MYPLEICSVGKLFALSPSTGNKQPRAIHIVFSAYLAQSDLLRLCTPENLFMFCWIGHFRLEWGFPSYCFQYSGETVFIPPGCCYFCIKMARENKFTLAVARICTLAFVNICACFFDDFLLCLAGLFEMCSFLSYLYVNQIYHYFSKLPASVHFEELRPSRIDEHQKSIFFDKQKIYTCV